MARSDPELLTSALLGLYEQAIADHRLMAESQRARREFFGADDVRPTVTQHLRFVEWFLLEHESLALATVPIEVMQVEGADEAVLGSAAGVYRVEAVDDQSATLHDLQDDDAVDAEVPPGALQTGDLVVGRLYPVERGTWQPSPAIAVYRPGQGIAAAFQRDVERLALDRRLSQLELEHLLLRRQTASNIQPAPVAGAPQPAATEPPPRPVEHIEAELDSVLAAGGAGGAATEISAALLETERPGTVIGPLLDQLAFDTGVDLERARRTLMELWHALHAADEPEPPPAPEGAAAGPPSETHDEPPGESLGERLVRTLDAGLGQKRDLGELFRQLEEMAGIEPDEGDDDALAVIEEAVAQHLPRRAAAGDGDGDGELDGDLGPLVTEFVWETGCGGSEVENLLQLWVGLQQNAALPHVDVDQVTAQDLMRLLLHVYLRAEPAARAAAVRDAFAAVERFSQWAESTQELSLRGALQGCQVALMSQLDRLQELGLRLSAPGAASAPSLLHVEDVGPDGFGVRSDDGSHWIAVPAATAALLREGDVLLGSLQRDRRAAQLGGLVVALPGDAEALIG